MRARTRHAGEPLALRRPRSCQAVAFSTGKLFSVTTNRYVVHPPLPAGDWNCQERMSGGVGVTHLRRGRPVGGHRGVCPRRRPPTRRIGWPRASELAAGSLSEVQGRVQSSSTAARPRGTRPARGRRMKGTPSSKEARLVDKGGHGVGLACIVLHISCISQSSLKE